MEMAAKATGRLAMAGGSFTAEYVEFEVGRALEWLSGENRNEGKRHGAVSEVVKLSTSIREGFWVMVQQITYS